MSAYRALRVAVACALVAVALSLATLGQANAPQQSSDPYLAHLSTDKPIYRAGELVYLRGVLLGANDHKPLPPDRRAAALIQITGPKGEQLLNSNTLLQDSIASFAWSVPDEAAGGQYTATIAFPYDGFPPAVRKFEVRAYRAPRLKGEIIFLRDGFGPGDTVKASLHVERAEGGRPAGAAVAVNAIVDGKDIYAGATKIDPAGNCFVEFPLPARIATGDGTLSLTISDGGVVEPIAKTIPILLNTVDLAIYPEGGDLIAGLPCRVYIEARTPAHKPADLVGVVLDSNGATVATLRTQHEGRGRFTFTPRADQTYSIKLSQPAGIDKLFPLPAVKGAGVCLFSDEDATAPEQSVKLHLATTVAGSYRVTLSKHETEISSLLVDAPADQAVPVLLTPPAWADGVLVATVQTRGGLPLAERLIFRRPSRSLHVKITPDKSHYVPADSASLTVTTTDDDGHPVAALVGLTATDDSVLQMLEHRDRAPHLDAMVLLEDDVRELADADVYLDPADVHAATDLDLLLGTQGWRRFASADEAKFLSSFGNGARRALANVVPVVTVVGVDVDDLRAAGAGDALGRGNGIGFGDGAAALAPFGVPAGGAGLAANPHAAPPVVLKDLDKAQEAQGAAGIGPFMFILPASQPAMQAAKFQVLRQQAIQPSVRIYAHDLRPGRRSGERADFTETLYWAAGVRTDATTGSATVSFKLNDAVTTFKVTADAFDSAGALGSASASIASVQPFYVEPKLPLEVTIGDVIFLPIAAVNCTDTPLDHVKLTMTLPPGLDADPIDSIALAPGSRARTVTAVRIGLPPPFIQPLPSATTLSATPPGLSTITITADAGAYSDQVTRSLSIKPAGFPVEIANGGILDVSSSVSRTIQIPASLVPGSITTSATLFPTPLGNLTEALKRLIQEPYGCFEQTTSTTYPLAMAQQYFLTHTGVDPALVAQSSDLLAKGYDRLLGFQCKNKGYEWFGEDPGHECLSAYGLLEFTDMAAVRAVDPTMLQNTRVWLLARRDGHGGYSHERRALHTWIADPGCANGYCTWALLECGEKNLDVEVHWLRENAATNPNSYVTALAANSLFLAGDITSYKSLASKLAELQDQDGHIRGATTTVVGSGGESLEVETTSLAALAFLRDNSYAVFADRAIHYLADSCKAGRYGSTQSTVLALRAIVAFDKLRAHPAIPGSVEVLVDGHRVGDPLSFGPDTLGALKLPDFSASLSPGSHSIALKMTDGSSLPYALAISFNSSLPSSSDQCKLALTASLKDATVSEGSATEAAVTVTNRTAEILPTPIAIIGLPGGLEVRHDQLKELVKSDRIAAYEVRGRDVILYWRDLQPNQRVDIPLSLTAAVPGTYTAPASRAYLYYTDEFKQWAPPMTVTISPK